MIRTSLSYFKDRSLMDIRLISTVGFDDQDIEDISGLDCVVQVMPSYFSDLLVTQNSIDSVVRVMALPTTGDHNTEMINNPVLTDGRLPRKAGECAMENYYLESSGYHIGDTIKLSDKTEGKDTSEFVKSSGYKIVGVVESPLYLTYQRGNTNVGDGSIAFYIMVPPEEFTSERYTVVYACTKASSEGISPFTDEYKDKIKDEEKEFEKISEGCLKRFNDTTLADAKKKLSDAQKEFDDKKAEAEEQLSDGEKQLRDGEEELYSKTAEAQKTIDDSEKELEDAKEKLKQGQEDYKKGIEDAKRKLKDAEEQYRDGLAKYNAAKTEYDTKIDEAEKKLAAARREYDQQYQIFYSSTKPQAETKLELMKTAIDLCNEAIGKTQKRLDELKEKALLGKLVGDQIKELEDKLKEYKAKISEYQKKYDEGKAMLAEGEKQLSEAKAKLDAADQELLDEKIKGAEKLSEAKIQLDNAEGQLESGKLEYQTALTTGMLELQSAQTLITEGEKQLENGKKELAEEKAKGMLQLKEAREKLARGRYEAYVQLTEAQKKLNDARSELENLEDSKWLIYNRDDNIGYSGLVEDADRVDSVSRVFPVFFLLIGALVCFTTMARMVEERRTETGTLKALGYSNTAIVLKYIIYAGAAALFGSIAGAAAGVFTLPIIIVDTYGIMYTLPPTVLEIDRTSLLISSGAAIVCICTVALAACFRDLRLSPAALMRPKAPKPGKRILLEYITPVWKHMSFTSKVTARNLFRYKARFFMTVVGVAGCTALMVAAMGLKDSVTGIAEKQFDNLTKYDQVYALSEAGTAKEKAYIMSVFHQDDRFDGALLSYMGWGSVTSENSGRIINGRLVIGADKESFEKMFILRDRLSHEPVALTDEGIVIDERAGMVLNVKKGDTIRVDIDGTKYPCLITGITENYAGNFVYMTPKYYTQLTGKEPEYGVVFTMTDSDDRQKEQEAANAYMKLDEIVTVSSINDQVKTMLDMMSSLDFIIFVMILCAGMLAVVVLYNLTNINIAERVREIATIKVLGFYSLETANFIYRESIVLTLVGAAAGMFLGDLFADFIISSIQMDNVMFPKGVYFTSYLFGFLLTIAFSLIVNFMMYFKMNKISMVESLKSIE